MPKYIFHCVVLLVGLPTVRHLQQFVWGWGDQRHHQAIDAMCSLFCENRVNQVYSTGSGILTDQLIGNIGLHTNY